MEQVEADGQLQEWDAKASVTQCYDTCEFLRGASTAELTLLLHTTSEAADSFSSPRRAVRLEACRLRRCTATVDILGTCWSALQCSGTFSQLSYGQKVCTILRHAKAKALQRLSQDAQRLSQATDQAAWLHRLFPSLNHHGVCGRRGTTAQGRFQSALGNKRLETTRC